MHLDSGGCTKTDKSDEAKRPTCICIRFHPVTHFFILGITKLAATFLRLGISAWLALGRMGPRINSFNRFSHSRYLYKPQRPNTHLPLSAKSVMKILSGA